jgi:hypothetical protein
MANGRKILRTLVAAVAVAPLLAAANPAAVRLAGSPTDTLNAAVASLKGQGYDINGTSGSTASGGTGSLTATGSVDADSTAATVDFHGTEGGVPVDLDFTQIGEQFFAKFDLGPEQSQLGVGADQWMLVDPSKITSPNALPFDLSGASDALDVAGLLTSVADVRYPDPSDPMRISGTVDLTAATGAASPDATDLKAAGAAAKTTPFTATVDGQGRLTDIRVDADAFNGNLSEEIRYSDFGSPDPVTAPPANSVIPAPESAYAFFNN